MKNIYVQITINDPYPKNFEKQGQGSTMEVAIKRALQQFRKESWSRRPLKEIKIYAKIL